MPKIALPSDAVGDIDFSVTKADIEDAIQSLELLLAGRIDEDNVAVTDTGYKALISHRDAVDVASEVRPVAGVKFFSSDKDNSPYKIFEKYNEKMNGSRQYVVLTKKYTKSFVNEDKNNFPTSFEFVLEKSPEIIPIENGTGDDYIPSDVINNYVLRANCQVDSNDVGESTWYWTLGVSNITEEDITFNVSIHNHRDKDFDESNFMTLSIEIFILCERIV